MVARIALFASVAAVVGFASAQLQVLSPVANSVNNVVWNCQQSQVQNFTILVANSDVKVLSGAEAIFAIEQNFDCSKALTVQQAAFVPATGYTVILANPLNSTDVYATSQPFEVKAQGCCRPRSRIVNIFERSLL
ncbi:hypothetical protein BD410DRAFT_93235 [Rickenella mellea]|uniref:Uncharacterized protein n=1 Tax=Rickenella mellea TaxID=50990 RepID=A0A4Y7QAB7_9AGAM|nr:hypothetical protein BD410DRAFT_93235 [Rickenella mellea]